MSKGVCIKRVVQAGLILLFAPLVGCTVLPVPSGTPGVIHFPTVESADWVTSLGSVCIQVEQSYTGLSSHTEPIAEELQGILSRIGVQATIGEGAGCEAVLSVTLQFTPIAEDVMGSVSDCYLDAEATGEATLSAAGYRTLTLPLKHSSSPGGGFIIYVCPTQPDEAPFDTVWAGEVTQMLREWWGSPALVSALKADTYALRWAATYQLTSIGPEASGAIPVLAEMLSDVDPQTRATAAEALGAFGPAGAEAVPALIEAINDTEPNVRYAVIVALGEIGDSQAVPALIKELDWEFNSYAARALESITGQDFGENAAAWQQWWESQP